MKLLRVLVHQVSQPLTSLLGEVELALRFESGEAELKVTLEKCLRGLEQMSRLVSDLRILGEMSEAAISNGSMLELANRAIEATGVARTSIKWRSCQDACIRTDPDLLRRALLRAFETAVSLRAPNSEVDVRLEKCKDAAALTLSFVEGDGIRAATVGSQSDVASGTTRANSGAEWTLIDAMVRVLGGRFEVHQERFRTSQTLLRIVFPLSNHASSKRVGDKALEAKALSPAGKSWPFADRRGSRASR